MDKISDRLWKKAAVEHVPLIAAFELLPVCNLQCKMCYVRKSMNEVKAAGGLLSADFWLDFARQARDAGLLFPLLTGGEPFMHPDFDKIYTGMRRMGLQVSINTNGTLIDSTRAKWLSENPPMRLNLTLYGASDATYANLCGDAHGFTRVCKAVEQLKHYGLHVKFNASITHENFDDLDEMVRFAHTMGLPIQIATYMFPPIRRDGRMIGQNHRLSPEKAAYARVKADWLQNDEEWFRGQAKRFSHFVPISDEMFADLPESDGNIITCRAGRCSFWIDWQGYLANCGMYAAVRYPLQNRPFAEVWQQIVDETEAFRYASVCTSCPNMPLCHTCVAMVYNECGDRNGRPDYLCRMNAASAKYYREFAKSLPISAHSKVAFETKEITNCGIETI